MSEGKIAVPEGMLKAATVAYNRRTHELGYKYVIDRFVTEATLEAALRWLSEHPSEITDEMWHQLSGDGKAALVTRGMANDFISFVLRRMFLAPEPKVPEEIANLLVDSCAHVAVDSDYINDRVREAHRRGQKAGTNAGK